MAKVEDLIAQYDFLNGRKQNNINYWQDIANFCHPRKSWVNSKRTPGEPLKLTRLYDSTGVRAARTCAAGIYSNLINPATEWHSWQTKDYEYMKDYSVKQWLKGVEKYLYATLLGTNFYSANLECIHDNVTFGTCAVMVLRDPIKKLYFQHIPLKQLVLIEDNHRRIIAFFRKFEWTAKQAFQEWGDESPKCVRDALQSNKPFQEFEFLHYVGERETRDVTKLNTLNMPIEEVYISLKEKQIIAEGGYEEFPLSVSRFYKDEADPFGISPAMLVLAEMRGINYKHKIIDRAAVKAIDPAYITPADGFTTPLNGDPGVQNFYDKTKVNAKMLAPLPFYGNIPIGIENITRDAEAIEKGFFVPLFQAVMNINKQMTVPEVQQRIAEGMALLSPVTNSMIDEFYSPQLARAYSILLRNNPQDFDVPPQEIMGQELRVVYQSPLIRAQKLSSLNSLASFWQITSTVIQVAPESQDKILMDKVIDVVADATSVDPSIIREDADVEIIGKERQQQQMEQAQLEQIGQGAEIVKTGSEAEKNLAEASA